jgi:hypothetical protein
MLQIGDRVRLRVIPPWAERMPEETREVMRQTLGKVFTIQGLREESGDVELWMRHGRDRRRLGQGVDVIWVEPEYLDLMSRVDEKQSSSNQA